MISTNCAIEVENSFLGSIIIDSTLGRYLEDIDQYYFSSDANRAIYSAMLSLFNKKIDINIPSIKMRLNEMGVGNIDISYLTELTLLSQVYAVESHIEILREKALRRTIIKACNKLMEEVCTVKDLDACIYNFENNTKSALEYGDFRDDDIVSIGESLLDLLEKDDKSKIAFGINLLDETIGGLFKGELTTIAAKSGLGKTALALQIMLNASKQGKKVLLITREMSKEQILMRNITKKTGISTNKMKSKLIDEDEWRQIIGVISNLNEENLIFINDKISTISQIKKRIRQIKPDLLIVDYVQLLTPPQNMNNREREVASISRELKNITLDFDISVIQLSQLNDELKDTRPWGERVLRESKAIYHDSNNVIFLHEPMGHEFEKAVETIGQSRASVLAAKERGIKLVDVIVAKCRDGEKKFKHFSYHGQRLHFQELNY